MRQINVIRDLLHEANERGVMGLTLKVDVIFGSQVLHLVGWRFEGETWVTRGYHDRIPFTHEQFNHALADLGWTMAQRPVKQAGLAYHWLLRPSSEAEPAHLYTSRTREDPIIDRRRYERMFASDLERWT